MAQGTPRKFSEKIAIIERRQNEDQEAFTSVMRDVRAITSNNQAASVCPNPQALAPPMHWNRSGGSLPNVHEMVQQQPDINNWLYWSASAQLNPSHHQARGRSPGAAHYHPYRSSKPLERNSPILQLDHHHLSYLASNQLQPPPNSIWEKARSDPTMYMNLHQNQQRLPSVNIRDVTMGGSNQNHNSNQASALQPTLAPFNPNTNFSSDMRKGVVMRDNAVTVGSLPNIARPVAAIPPYTAYHQTIAQRNSMGVCQTLTTPVVSLSESQSAPTSPAQSVELPVPTSWPQRKYSNSPEPREIPNIVLTGTDGQLDCFQDLQELHLDARELQQLLNSGEQADSETQLLE